MTTVIGLTGGIGSGKSTVAQFLTELGAIILDADKIGHEVYRPNTEAWNKIVATFGQQILSPTGEVDRKKLGKIVFSDPESRLLLSRIVQPELYETAKARIEEYRRQDVDMVVFEAHSLGEGRYSSLVDEVWAIVVPEAIVLKRVKEQRGLDKEQTLARIRSQLSSEERVKHADVVINNDGDFEEVKTRVKELWARLHA